MTSKFRGIIEQAKGRDPEPAEAAPDPDAAPVTPAPAGQAAATPKAEPPSPAPPDPAAKRGPGRPPGKRSDPGYVQTTAYIPAELHHGVKLALLQERAGREFSELVGDLLAEWLRSRI
jgi:hypothetical protein